MLMPGRSYNSAEYRWGFNGMEKDDEVSGSGNSYTTDFRQVDPRLGGRWWSPDLVVKPWESPYAGFANNPIYFVDPIGLDPETRTVQTPTDENSQTTVDVNLDDNCNLESVEISAPRANRSASASTTTQQATAAGNPTPDPVNSGPLWARDVIHNWQHQWDGTNWGGEKGTDKYSPPGTPDGVTISIGGNIGHGAVGRQGVSLSLTGEGAITHWVTGGGPGSEGLSGAVSIAFLYKTEIGQLKYKAVPLPLQDISGSGIQVSGSADLGLSFGGSYGYNLKPSNNSLAAYTYRSVGISAGVGIAGAPLTGSYQVSVAIPIVGVDKYGFYLGSGR